MDFTEMVKQLGVGSESIVGRLPEWDEDTYVFATPYNLMLRIHNGVSERFPCILSDMRRTDWEVVYHGTPGRSAYIEYHTSTGRKETRDESLRYWNEHPEHHEIWENVAKAAIESRDEQERREKAR